MESGAWYSVLFQQPFTKCSDKRYPFDSKVWTCFVLLSFLAFTPKFTFFDCNFSRVMIFVLAFLSATLSLFRKTADMQSGPGMSKQFLPILVAIEHNCINVRSRTSSLAQLTSPPTCALPGGVSSQMTRSSDCNIHISLEFGYYVVGVAMKRRGRSGEISGPEMLS